MLERMTLDFSSITKTSMKALINLCTLPIHAWKSSKNLCILSNYFLALAVFFLFPSASYAQTQVEEIPPSPPSEATQAPTADTSANDLNIKLIQPYDSKHFGKITLPAFWRIEESETLAQCFVIEEGHPQPLSLSLILTEKIPKISEDKLFDASAQALAKTLENGEIRYAQPSQIAKDKSVKRYLIHTHGFENAHERDCFSLLIYIAPKMLSLNLCGYSQRPFQSQAESLLNQIFDLMQ